MTTEFREAILATIAYHDVLGLPLTRLEVEKYLVRVGGESAARAHPEHVIARSEIPHGVYPRAKRRVRDRLRNPEIAAPPEFILSRVEGVARNDSSGQWGDVGDALAAELPKDLEILRFAQNDAGLRNGVRVVLEDLTREGELVCVNGFWCLAGREHLAAERIEKHKLAETKWKIVQRWGRLLAYVPFVRAVFVSGSLVFHNTYESSDLDVLIITKYGRIWTTRVLASGLMGLFGRRRHGDKIKDRICFNHFLTDQSLRMPYPSLYNAMTYARLTVLFELGVTHAAFLAANHWISEYLYRQPMARLVSRKTLRRPFGSAAAQRASEWLLGGWFGNQLERLFRTIQRRRIEADPRSFEPGGRVVADDTQLEFHPASPEVGVLAAYYERLKALGLECPVSRT